MQYAVMQAGEAVGVAEVDERFDPDREAELVEAYVEEDGGVEIFADCTEEDHRPCELTVALEFAQDLAREVGVSSAEIDALQQQGYGTEEDAKAAVCAVIGRLPEGIQLDADSVERDYRLEGQMILDETWGEGCSC